MPPDVSGGKLAIGSEEFLLSSRRERMVYKRSVLKIRWLQSRFLGPATLGNDGLDY